MGDTLNDSNDETPEHLKPVNESEEKVIEGARTGEEVNCHDENGDRSSVRASLIRELAIDAYPGLKLHQKGLRIIGAKIEGVLDLENCEVRAPLGMQYCLFGEPPKNEDDMRSAETVLSLRDAHLKLLDLQKSEIYGKLNAQAAKIKSNVFLDGAKINGETSFGNTTIGGQFLANKAIFNNPEGKALFAQGTEVNDSVFLDGAKLNGETRFSGATIGGQFLADTAEFNNPERKALFAQGAEIKEGVFLRGAKLSGETSFSNAKINYQILADNAEFRNPEGTAFNAAGAFILDCVFLDRAKLNGKTSFTNTTIGGQLNANKAEFNNPEGSALNAQGAEIKRGVFLDGAKLNGETRFSGAKIRGQFLANKAIFNNPEGAALIAQGAEINDGVFLRGAKLNGETRFSRATIGGQLLASKAIFKNPEGAALFAQSADIKEGVFLGGAKLNGVTHFGNTTIGGQFSANKAIFNNPEGKALSTLSAEIKESVFLVGAKLNGETSFTNATIGGLLNAKKAEFVNPEGNAIQAQVVEIKASVLFRKAQFKGRVHFLGAKLSSFLAEGAQLEDSEIALELEGADISGNCCLSEGFQAKGSIEMDRVKIGEVLDFRGSQLQNPGKTALSLQEAQINRLIMPDRTEHCPKGIVDLTFANIDFLEDVQGGWPRGDNANYLILNGLRYTHLENPAGIGAKTSEEQKQKAERNKNKRALKARLDWLERQKPEDTGVAFKTQPWIQLTKQFNEQGLFWAARQIGIERRRRMRKATLPFWSWARLQSWFLDTFAEYGFNPWKTVRWSLFSVVIFAGLWAVAYQGCEKTGCKDESVFVKTRIADYHISGKTYPDFSPPGFAFDSFIPLFDFGYQDSWTPNTAYGMKPIDKGSKYVWKLQVPIPTACLTVIKDGYESCPGPKMKWLHITSLTFTTGMLWYSLYILEVVWGLVLVSMIIFGFTGLLSSDD